jgi:uncharacterized protein YeaO (DUF488 family)
MKVALKRVYAEPAAADGLRILVDRLWPRGLSKQAARVDAWLRAIAPSNELRRWYHAHPTQWPKFRKLYLQELCADEALNALQQLHQLGKSNSRITLLFGSRNLERNNAVVLKQLLEGARKPPSSSGPAAAVAARARGRAKRSRS